MKIAVAVWQDRLSPVFDASHTLCVIRIDEIGKEENRKIIDVQVAYPSQRVTLLMDLEVEVLICGAISSPLSDMVVSAGIRLVPFVAGETESVLAAFLRGELPSPAYMMPGCGGRRRRHRRGCNWQ